MPYGNKFKANIKGGGYTKPKKGPAKIAGKKIAPKFPQDLKNPKNRSTANLDKSGFAVAKPAMVSQSGPYNRGEGCVG